MKILAIIPTLGERSYDSLAMQLKKQGVNIFPSLNKPSEGQGYAKNKGLIMALIEQYDAVLTIDDDDLITGNYVQNMIDAYNGMITYTDYLRTDGINVVLANNLSAEYIKTNNGLSSFVMANPSFLLSIGGYSPFALHEDWELNYRIALLGYGYSVNHKGGYIYAISPDSASNRNASFQQNTFNQINTYVRR